MGEATDKKMTEINDTRRRLEADLLDLEARIPAPFRSAKSLTGMILGSTVLAAVILRSRRSKRSDGHAAAEVVVRIVRDDL